MDLLIIPIVTNLIGIMIFLAILMGILIDPGLGHDSERVLIVMILGITGVMFVIASVVMYCGGWT